MLSLISLRTLAMQRKVTFVVLAIFVCTFVVSVDRFVQRAFFNFVLSSFNPSKDQAHLEATQLKTEKFVKDFPEKFLIGSSSSAYQIEGAWDEQGNLITRYS